MPAVRAQFDITLMSCGPLLQCHALFMCISTQQFLVFGNIAVTSHSSGHSNCGTPVAVGVVGLVIIIL